tara:strand:+ start:194 stop:583 length:390 start_codon:yes stop_codon:yes gene_type:complete
MNGFSDVKISWKGDEFTIPANSTLMLIAQMESILSGDTGEQAISVLLRAGGPPHSALAMAYGAALRHAGCEVTDGEIYLSIQADLAENSTDAMVKVNASIVGLLGIMSPPLASKVLGDDAEKKTKAAKG